MEKVSKINKNINKENMINNTIIFQGKDGGIEFKNDITKETIWANQAQIAMLFNIERSVVTKHISNIFKDNELDKNSTCANFAQVQKEGNREVERKYLF